MDNTRVQTVARAGSAAGDDQGNPMLWYTPAGVWLARDEVTGIVRLGVTDVRQHAGAPAVFVELPERGMSLDAGDELADIETEEADLSLPAPFGGTVIAINEQLASTPALVNQDPYGAGWLVEVRPAGWPVEGLLDQQAYALQSPISP